jgi:hypothetical protein
MSKRNQLVGLLCSYMQETANNILRSNDCKKVPLLDTAKNLVVKTYSQNDELIICQMILSNRLLLTRLNDNYQLRLILKIVSETLLNPHKNGLNKVYFTLES